MPTPSRTGTASQVDASGGNGSISVTVPSDATAALAYWAHWDGDAGSSLATLTLNGVGFTILQQQVEGIDAQVGVGCAILEAPATGSQTLAWTWSAGGARTEGGELVIVWIKDHKSGDAVRDSDIATGTFGANVSITLTTEADDLLIAHASNYTNSPALDGTVFINNASLNSHVYDTSQVTPNAGSTTVNLTGEEWTGMAAISLKVSPTGNVQQQSYRFFQDGAALPSHSPT